MGRALEGEQLNLLNVAPIVLNSHGLAPDEYARYVAFWSSVFRASLVGAAGLGIAFLVGLRLFVVGPILRELERVRVAVEDQTSIIGGGGRASSSYRAREYERRQPS